MAVLICVCSWISVPAAVPFTMQTFAVFCSLLLLGGKDGTAAIGLYLLMGAAGLPVFSGFRGGIGHLLGPTGGYVIGFLFSGIIYMMMEPLIMKKRSFCRIALSAGLAGCYFIGTLWFTAVYMGQGSYFSFTKVLSMCVLPYIIPDLLKMSLAVYLSGRIRKYI